MVTFVCSNCDTTLKKKQVERHCFGSCRPPSFICIDCHQTFQGFSYKDHTSCLTQYEKHWGDYAKPKQITQPNPNPPFAAPKLPPPTHSQQSKNVDGPPQPSKKDKKAEGQEQPRKALAEPTKVDWAQNLEVVHSYIQEKKSQSEWKGWKNEIKQILKENEKRILKEELEERVMKRYRDCNPEEDIEDEEIRPLIEEKMKKIKKVKLQTYVSLD